MNTRKNNIFKEIYSEYYDLIYKEKDYRNECERILNFLKKKKVNKVLEIGCGTCSHSIILAKENFQIVGIDNSLEMLKVAKKKISHHNLSNIQLIEGNAEKINKFIHEKFDVVLILFNVVGYLSNLESFINKIRSFLNINSTLIFDFWHQEAIEFNGPRKTTKIFKRDDSELERISQGVINSKKKIVEIKVECSIFKNKKFIGKTTEVHELRYYCVDYLRRIITKNGFKIEKFEDFKTKNIGPQKKNWSAYCVAKFLG